MLLGYTVRERLYIKAVWSKFLIIAFFIGYHIKFDLIGSLSMAEVISLLSFFVLAYRGLWEVRQVRVAAILYAALEVSKIFSEFFVSNGLAASLKGLAIPVFSFTNTMFLLYLMTKNIENVWLALLSMVLSSLLFGSSFDEESTFEEVASGESAAYLKFYLAPLIGSVVLLASRFFATEALFAYAIMGILFVILGARSSGMVMFLSAFVAFLAGVRPNYFRARRILVLTLLLSISLYPLYVVYANKVLDGKIKSGNSEQLLRAENPYNPIELLKQGRVDAWAAWQAFMDKPLLGHGAWAYDYSMRYLFIELDLTGEKYMRERFKEPRLVPSHSVLINQGSQNGIAAFLIMLLLLLFFVKCGLEAVVSVPRKYRLLVSHELISLLWAACFSPPSHFRNTFPFIFALFLALSLKYRYHEGYFGSDPNFGNSRIIVKNC